MKKTFRMAAAEQGIGFFSFDHASRHLEWDDETGRQMGAAAEAEKEGLFRQLSSPLRAYLLGSGNGANDRRRALVALKGEVMEVVLLPAGEEGGGVREGYFIPRPLHESRDLMRRYLLSGICTGLRSLLSSVIIAGEAACTLGCGEALKDSRFLTLMTEDAREVQALLSRMGGIIDEEPPGAASPDGTVNVSALLAEIHASLRHLAQEASITLGMALPDSLPAARGSYSSCLLIFFLAFHAALSLTGPMGEIIVTAGERDGWKVEIWHCDGEIPSNWAVFPRREGLEPIVPDGWSRGAALQIIDALLGLRGLSLEALGNGRGLGVLAIPLLTA